MIHVIDDIYIDATRDCYIVGIPKKRKDGTIFLSSPNTIRLLKMPSEASLTGFCTRA